MATAIEALKANAHDVKQKAETVLSVLPVAVKASIDPKLSEELKRQLEKLSKAYNDYMATQKNFVLPVAQVSIDETNEGITTHIEVEFNGIPYHLESFKPEHTHSIHAHLEQKIVKEKFGDGSVKTPEETSEMVAKFSALYSKKERDGKSKTVNPYSGLVVTDAESHDFLGITFLLSEEPGKAEIGLLNSAKTWSQIPKEVIAQYASVTATAPAAKIKTYNGVGTMEVCTMLQYGAHLKNKGYKATGETLDAIVSTARVDNMGSWKAHAKAGFKLEGIWSNLEYGPELRYQMKSLVN